MADRRKYASEIPTVRFDPTLVTESIRADLRENIEGLSEIVSSNVSTIYEAALRAISVGGDLHTLTKVLIGLGISLHYS